MFKVGIYWYLETERIQLRGTGIFESKQISKGYQPSRQAQLPVILYSKVQPHTYFSLLNIFFSRFNLQALLMLTRTIVRDQNKPYPFF